MSAGLREPTGCGEQRERPPRDGGLVYLGLWLSLLTWGGAVPDVLVPSCDQARSCDLVGSLSVHVVKLWPLGHSLSPGHARSPLLQMAWPCSRPSASAWWLSCGACQRRHMVTFQLQEPPHHRPGRSCVPSSRSHDSGSK